jgi:hypothetical protein
MRRLLASLLVILSGFGNFALGQDKAPAAPVSAPVAALSQPPPPNTLQDGTAIKLRLAENLTSATAKMGQQVSFEVVEEVDVEGVPVIAQGAQALVFGIDNRVEPAKLRYRSGWKLYGEHTVDAESHDGQA